MYYHEHFELPEEEVMDKAQKVTTKTTYLTIHGLLACERYFFRVAAFSPYCPLSDPVTVETSEGKNRFSSDQDSQWFKVAVSESKLHYLLFLPHLLVVNNK